MEISRVLIDSRNQISVFLECGKSLKIAGELTLSPAFYADSSSIIYWNQPVGKLKITERERNAIVSEIVEKSKREKWGIPIYFDK